MRNVADEQEKTIQKNMLKNEEKCRDFENQDPNEYDYNYRC